MLGLTLVSLSLLSELGEVDGIFSVGGGHLLREAFVIGIDIRHHFVGNRGEGGWGGVHGGGRRDRSGCEMEW